MSEYSGSYTDSTESYLVNPHTVRSIMAVGYQST